MAYASFSHVLRARVLATLGVAVVAGASCSDDDPGTGGSGGTGTTSSTTTTATSTHASSTSGSTTSTTASTTVGSTSGSTTASTGTGGMQNVERCWSNLGSDACPDAASAAATFGSCTDNLEYVTAWLGAGTPTAGMCCYLVNVTDPGDPMCGVIGRPFVVDARARTASIRQGDEAWRAPELRSGGSARLVAEPRVEELDEATRLALAAEWAAEASYEHASVASFGKLSLELMSFGAPARLVAGAHEAALDEIRHAAFGLDLASAYAGARLTPGEMPEARAFAFADSITSLAIAAVREGCVGETLSAVVAAAQRDAASDPAVREALTIVAEDEARHAELSWAVVAWAFEAGGEATRSAIRSAFAEAIAEERARAEATAHVERNEAMRAHGRLSESESAAVRLSAIADVVEPALVAFV